MSYQQERWFELLAEAVAKSNKNMVAQQIGMSRTAISLVMSGKYTASTKRVAIKVLAALDRWACPYLGADITSDACNAVHAGATPSHDPAQLAHRRMCRSCQHNTSRKEQ